MNSPKLVERYLYEFRQSTAPYTIGLLFGTLGLILFSLKDINIKLFLFINSIGKITPSLWSIVTYFGDGRFIAGVLIITFWKRYNLLGISILSALSVHFGVQFLKNVFEILRPEYVVSELGNFIGPTLLATDYAFPSGHSAATAMCAFLILRTLKNPTGKLLALFAAAIVALSRVIVGAHWPADVLAGFAFGSIIVFTFSFIRVNNKLAAGIVYAICFYLSLTLVIGASSTSITPPTIILDKILGISATVMCILGFVSNVLEYNLAKIKALL